MANKFTKITPQNIYTILGHVKKSISDFRILSIVYVYTNSFSEAKRLVFKSGNKSIYSKSYLLLSEKFFSSIEGDMVDVVEMDDGPHLRIKYVSLGCRASIFISSNGIFIRSRKDNFTDYNFIFLRFEESKIDAHSRFMNTIRELHRMEEEDSPRLF